MKKVLQIGAAGAVLGFSLFAQAGEPHVHGEGRLQIVQQGESVKLTLVAPTASFWGFEHEAHSAAEKAAVTKLRKQLSNGSAMFGFDAAGNCQFINTKLNEKVTGHDDHDHGHEHKSAAKDGKKTAHKEHEEHEEHEEHAQHRELTADYSVKCSKPAALEKIQLKLFKSLPNLKKLHIEMVGDAGLQIGGDVAAGESEFKFR